jgi:hypothetical protein
VGAWTVVASRLQPRTEGGLVALPGGRVVAFGGIDAISAQALTSSELFDPVKNEWHPTSPLYAPHVFARDLSVILPGGDALVAGGEIDSPLDLVFRKTAIVETFDTAAEVWSVAGALSEGRMYHTVTVLGDGTVIAVGGVPDTDDRPDAWREPLPSPSAVGVR